MIGDVKCPARLRHLNESRRLCRQHRLTRRPPCLATSNDGSIISYTLRLDVLYIMDSTSVDADTRHYVDRAIQTDNPTSTACTFDESSSSLIIKTSSDMDMSSSSIVLTSAAQSDTSIAVYNDAYSHDELPLLSSPPASIKTTERVLKASNERNIKSFRSSTSRVVSLPETVSAYSAKKTLEKTARVVSNPEYLKHRTRSPADDSSFSDHSLDPFSGTQRASRVRVRSTATDIPHTPSPPSSPESIVIIANKTHLMSSQLDHCTRILYRIT